MWVVWANTQFATVWFLCLSFFGFLVMHTGRTNGPILTTYVPYDVFLGKDVSFGGYLDVLPFMGSDAPKTPILGS